MASNKTLTIEQRLQKANFSVINHIKYCAIGGVIMYGNTSIVGDEEGSPLKHMPTAGTNGRDVVYHKDFIAKLSDPQLRFVVLHENYHKAYRHMTVWKALFKKNPPLANVACDMVINNALMDLDAGEKFIEMVPGGCLDPKYRGMDSGTVFRMLEQQLMKMPQSGKGKGKGGGPGQPGGEGFDEHFHEDAESMSEAEKEAIGQEIDRALRQGAILAGKRKGQMDRSLGELLEPKIDWREVLREFVTSICAGRDMSTWRKVNRRSVGMGVYMPGSFSETVGRIVIGVDTSGSIGGPELREFLSEVVGVAKAVQPEMVDLLYWDNGVAGHEKYSMAELDQIATSTKPKGGGGTSPSCITQYMAAQNPPMVPECVIVLTDGYVGSDWGGNWPCPVLWCIAPGHKIYAPNGKTVWM